MKTDPVFVLEIDGRPTLVFDAPNADVAHELCDDDQFRADLISMTANGTPICSARSQILSRSASPREIAAFEYALHRASASDEPIMVFLVKIDGVVMMSIDSST